jgi:A118 family predicted phage portal protein
MFKNVIMWILTNVFRVQTETKQKEIDDNAKYASDYEAIDSINYNAIFSNKLANYVVNDSNLNITGENARVDLLNKTGQSMWKKAKKIASMALGYGGLVIVPYVKNGKIYYTLVPQNRVTIDEMDGDNIISATILAEKKVISTAVNTKTYLRWSRYVVENNNVIITQKFTDDKGKEIDIPSFWANVTETMTITGVDRVLFGFIKSPINNRNLDDKYGVPITYGCDETIEEIKETLTQIAREYDLKQAFVGADVTMFNGENGLPTNGLFKKIDAGDDSFFEEFSPAIRESSYYARLQELYQRLEKEIGTSKGVISDAQTSKATATEVKREMYDTFAIVDDMRTNIEKGMEDFFYSCNVLANAYNLSPQGEYELGFDWSYALLQDTQQEFNNMMQAENKGIVKKAEIRQWLFPDETIEDAQKAIDEISSANPDIKTLLGTNNEE